MFAKNVQREVAVDGEVVVVRKLSGKSLEKARVARRSDQVASIRELGADLIKAFREGKEAAGIKEEPEAVVMAEPAEKTPEEKAAERKASFNDYDRYVVLQAGIVSWTAKDEKGKPVPVTAETIDGLDAESVAVLSDAILDLSLPADVAEAKGKD